jgi:hypothetical protein
LNRQYGIHILDGIDLYSIASSVPDLLDSFQGILDWNWEVWLEVLGNVVSKERTREDILEGLRSTQLPDPVNVGMELRADSSSPPDADLCVGLTKIKPGNRHWPTYEKHCEKIIMYLFGNDLGQLNSQLRTIDGRNRYDLICRIRGTGAFWRFLMEGCGSRYVVFECKNCTTQIGQGEILTTEKYLQERALRRVAIVLTRKGENGASRAMREGAMREHGKLILVLSDGDLCHMLAMRDKGEDPSDYLLERMDYFLMTLPR